MKHGHEFVRRRGEHGFSMADDRDHPAHLPTAQPDDAEGAGAQLGSHGELAATGHAMAASDRQLHGFPVGQLQVLTWTDADVRPGGLHGRLRGRSLVGRDPCHRFRIPARHPAARQPGMANDEDFLLDQRLRLDLRRSRESADDAELGASIVCAEFPCTMLTPTPGWARRKATTTSGKRYVAGTPDATTVSDPVTCCRNSPTPRAACARSARARSTWLARNSPAGVRSPPRGRRTTSFTPASRSSSAMCLETAG